MRHAAKPVLWTSGLLTGSSFEILPWNLAWAFLFWEGGGLGLGLGSVEGAIQSRFEVEKPPMSLSEKTLQVLISSAF